MSMYETVLNAPAKIRRVAWQSLHPLERANLKFEYDKGDAESAAHLADIAENGADGGEAGLTYNEDMYKRVARKPGAYLAYIATEAYEMGIDFSTLVLNARFFSSWEKLDVFEEFKEKGFGHIEVFLCWYCAENGARKFCDYIEQALEGAT